MHSLRGHPFIALRIPILDYNTSAMVMRTGHIFFPMRGSLTSPDATIYHMAPHQLLWPLATWSETCLCPPPVPLTLADKFLPLL